MFTFSKAKRTELITLDQPRIFMSASKDTMKAVPNIPNQNAHGRLYFLRNIKIDHAQQKENRQLKNAKAKIS